MENTTVTMIELITIGATLNMLQKDEIIAMLTKNKVNIEIVNEQWIENTVALPRENTIEVSNRYAKATIGTDKKITINRSEPEQLTTGIIAVLDVIYQLNNRVTLADGYFVSGIPESKDYVGATEETNPVRIKYSNDKPSVLPIRVGIGRRKSREDVQRILSPYMLSIDNYSALAADNKSIYESAKACGGKYTDLLTDVIIRTYGDDELIIESDTYSLKLPAAKKGGYNTPYTVLSSISARHISDLQEIANILHAITTLRASYIV